MLKLALSAATEDFRRSFKEWLAAHAPPKPSGSSLQEFIELGRKWQRSLASGGWIGVHWPKEFGGKGLTLVEEAIVQEELTRIGSPQLLGLFGLTMVGPVLIKHGTENQKSAYLSKILNAEEIWCQGFSEPGAGSDLAAIKTRAVVSEQGFHVTGQKVWTSFAQIADWCFLLARTSDEPTKHAGLSYLLVPMKSKGITVRPLKQISGDEEFNEVFFDNVFVPKENIVGAIGEGWKIAISTLMYERVVLTFARQLQSEVALRGLVERFGKDSDFSKQFSLANEVVAACAVRALSYRHLVQYASGKSPGPEGSLDKLLWSETFQRLCKLAMDLLGENALASELDAKHGGEIHRYLYSRGRTIAAGTSEIQRSIIAERVLGLPRGKLTI